MAGGHNRGGLPGYVGHTCRGQNAARDGSPRPRLTDLFQTSTRQRATVIGTAPARQSRKATSRRVAAAARRSVSEFAKQMSSGDARRKLARKNGMARSPHQRTARGRDFAPAKSERPLRAQGFRGFAPVPIRAPARSRDFASAKSESDSSAAGVWGGAPIKKGRLLATSLIPNTKLLTANTQDNLS